MRHLVKRETSLLWSILLLPFLFYTWFIQRTAFLVRGERYYTLIDDAMISMRYAKHLAGGYGLVWNIGEAPIEGFTNLGWTLHMGILHLLPIAPSKISLLPMVTSALLLLGIAFLTFSLSQVIRPEAKRAPLMAAIVTSFYFPLVFWSLRGMEVGAVTFLVYLSVLIAIDPFRALDIKRACLLGSIMLLAILVRFDAVLQISLVVGYLLYASLKAKRFPRPAFVALLFCLVGIVGVLLFQSTYFGSLVPNTYYLKVTGVTLLERVDVGLDVFLRYAARDVLGLLFVVVAGLLFFKRLRDKRVFLLLALFLVQCIYSVYVGGDYAEPLTMHQVGGANRFITQGMPSLIILFSVVVDCFLDARGVKSRPGRGLSSPVLQAVSLGLITLTLISGSPWMAWLRSNAPLLETDIWLARLGLQIGEATDGDVIVAAHAIGQISYYSDRRMVDLLGINDRVVAAGHPATSFRPGHNKWNYAYSISALRPDLVADEWGESNVYLADQPDYYQLENGIWLRKGGPRVDVEKLAQPYR